MLRAQWFFHGRYGQAHRSSPLAEQRPKRCPEPAGQSPLPYASVRSHRRLFSGMTGPAAPDASSRHIQVRRYETEPTAAARRYRDERWVICVWEARLRVERWYHPDLKSCDISYIFCRCCTSRDRFVSDNSLFSSMSSLAAVCQAATLCRLSAENCTLRFNPALSGRGTVFFIRQDFLRIVKAFSSF